MLTSCAMQTGVTPLMLAVEGCHVSSCKFLLEKAVNVNAVDDKRGYTALHIASTNGHVSIIPLLIKAGADINIQDRSGVLESERIREAFAQGGALIGNLLGMPTKCIESFDGAVVKGCHVACRHWPSACVCV
jgi:ankyrin repeat protein